MKIFMLVSRVPWPLEKGDKLRAYHQLKELAKRHEVFLCCLSDSKVHPQAYAHLKQITPHVKIIRLNKLLIGYRLLLALFDKKPFQVHYFFQKAVAKRIHQLIDQFQPNHIYCQLIRTSEYVKHLHQYKKTLDYMDALSVGQRRRLDTASLWMKPFIREESKRLTAYENLIFDYFDFHTIISNQDKQLIFHEHRQKIQVVPNGVNNQYFFPTPSEKKYDLIFTGNMSYPPNIDCALRTTKEILPLIHIEYPSVTFLIAGANPHPTITQLESQHIHVSGWLEDIRSAYNSSSIFIAPMRIGSGLQNKLLEAMSMELPCITTALAANPMNGADNEMMIVKEKNEDLASAVISLMKNPEKAKQMALRGRQFVCANFDWEKTVFILEEGMLSS